MRFVTYDRDGTPQPAVLRGAELVDLDVPRILDLIRLGGDGLRLASAALDRPANAVLDDVHLLSPIPEPERFVLATGWNYLEHFNEGIGKRNDTVVELPEYPSFFAKADTTVIGPRDPLPYDAALTEQLDGEGEIAVVIGFGGRNIPVDQVPRHLFGYTLANDVTARDIQRRHGGQWLKGKSVDGTCPLGPALVTPDELDPAVPLDLTYSVNGELMQDATTDLMIFSIAELVSSLSEAMTLQPGDILLTGTPAGAGYARNPPMFLAPGDEVVVASSVLGELRNRVVEQSLTTYTPHAVESAAEV
jgi:2-keto-4-pentenoate hydratase/2-oxohepta-3-ene-1,7-dioic acid hydratase in catechol pathway